MSDTSPLRLAEPQDVADALAFALRYAGRKRVHHADDIMARITADRLVQHLKDAGYVVMKAPSARAPTTSHMPLPPGRE
jgi:hypothetical protein